MAGITPAIKRSRDFKEFIGFLARTDAVHDFGSTELNYDTNVVNINKGLNEVSQIEKTNEHGALWSVLIDLPGQRNHSEELKDFLNSPSLSTENFSDPFQVGFRSLENSDLIKFIISDQIGYIFIQIYIHEKVVQVQHQSLIVQISY